jgi:hypothetical protein
MTSSLIPAWASFTISAKPGDKVNPSGAATGASRGGISWGGTAPSGADG